jgi:hypothetical protein
MTAADSIPMLTRGSRRSFAYDAGCFVLMLAALQLTIGPKVRLSQWGVSAERNASVAEGVAWLNGRLDIPHDGKDAARDRMHDTAYFNGKVYNVFPPLIPLLTVILSPLHHTLIGRTDMWLPWPYTLLVFWPLPILGFIAFKRQTGDAAWAALFVVAWMGGTAVLPNLIYARGGELGQINHVVSQAGLLLIAIDLLGRQRIWPAMIGLFIATWTRQMCLLYAIPIAIVAWQQRRIAWLTGGLIVIVAPLLTLNYLKFASAFDFGYRHIYFNRENEEMGRRCLEHGVFSTHFFLENLKYMHLAPPRLDISPTELRLVETSTMGTSIWLTSPLCVWVILAAARWWAHGPSRLLILGTIPVMAGLALYHSPGFLQSGYNRFALDFLPIWLAVISPFIRGGWRTWVTLAMTAYSLLYFQQIL